MERLKDAEAGRPFLLAGWIFKPEGPGLEDNPNQGKMTWTEEKVGEKGKKKKNPNKGKKRGRKKIESKRA